MSLMYSLIKNEDGERFITVIVPGSQPQVAGDSHPNFEAILAGVLKNDASVIDLFDIAKAASQKFERLSERITAQNGRLYLDGEEVDNALATQVMRFHADGLEDWKPLVNFFENVQANPNAHSREQLYPWLDQADFTITDEGYIVGYKGVASDGNGGYVSINSGRAIVNGEVKTGRIPNPIGAVVEMPRSEVAHDPATGCSTGLHVGTYGYASTFGSGGTLEVHVNPRDVVSVPTDCDHQKMRVCRYTVVGVVDEPYSSPLRPSDGSDAWGDGENYCDDCGEYLEDCECSLNDPSEPDEVYVGDVFEDRDSRRAGRTLTVEYDDGTDHVLCRSSSSGKLVRVSVDRLLSRKYRRV